MNKWAKKHWKPIIGTTLGLCLIFWFLAPELILYMLGVTFYIFVSTSETSYPESPPKKKFKKTSFAFGRHISVLSYYFMMADGEISEKEKNFYLNFLQDEFKVNYKTKRLLRFFDSFNQQKFTLKTSTERLAKIISPRERVKLLHYLVGLITSDKFLSVQEIAMLRTLCKRIKVHYKTLDSVLALYNYTSQEDLNRQTFAKTYTQNSITRYYKILELDSSATISEIKAAYRKLAKRYHPDKQQVSSTNQKFITIQKAYEKIKTHKGFS